MSENAAVPQSRTSVFDRIRGPMTLLMIAMGGFILYYALFFQRKTAYYTDRNGRMIARLGEQVGRAISSANSIVTSATQISEEELQALYESRTTPATGQLAFTSIAIVDDPDGKRREKREVERTAGGGLTLVFEGPSQWSSETSPLYAPQKDKPDPAKGLSKRQYVSAKMPLRRLIDPIVRQTSQDVFDTVFILDSSGNVVYQPRRQSEDESEPPLKIVQLGELHVPQLFKEEKTLKVTELMSASRQMPVRIGDSTYQLFSVPLRLPVEAAPAGKPAAAGTAAPSDMWVIGGVVSNAEFRSRSLTISMTLLACLAAVVLLMIFSWPFMKMGLSSAYQKVTLVDVILLGISGIFALSVVTAIIFDWFTFRRLEGVTDRQLVALGQQIESNFKEEIRRVVGQLDALQEWAESPDLAAAPPRNPNLLDKLPLERPYFQSFAYIRDDGWQHRKWFIDKEATAIINVSRRPYFTAPKLGAREYLTLSGDVVSGNRRLNIEPVRSMTSGEPEVIFSRRTDEHFFPGASDALRKCCPVVTLSMPSALSIVEPVLPQDFHFAIVNDAGLVLFHSRSELNTVEHFFVETDENPNVRSAVQARQKQVMNVRYWGEDYRAYVHPMKGLPWTLITFRDKEGLRALNSDALMITFIFLLVIFGAGLLFFIALVLLVRPRYRAQWLWPDPRRVRAYAELAAAYAALLAAGITLILTLRGVAMVIFPFWFVPLALLVTYLYLRPGLRGPKRVVFVALTAISTASLLIVVWRNQPWSIAAIAASALLLGVATRAVVRKVPPDDPRERMRERQTALPLCYVAAAFLLLLAIAVIPTAAYFRSAYQLRLTSYVKAVQMKLARDMQARWWRISAEFDDARGAKKSSHREKRWNDPLDVYSAPIFGTTWRGFDPLAGPARPRETGSDDAFFALVEPILPRYSGETAITRELRGGAADNSWWWASDGAKLDLVMNNPPPVAPFRISSTVPSLLPSWSESSGPGPAPASEPEQLPVGMARLAGRRLAAAGAVGILLILAVAFAIARFIARRVFLVDVFHPLWLSHGFLGMRRVICHPCDDDSARKLFRDFKKIDLRSEADLEIARNAPHSFDGYESAVFIDGLGFPFASGERAELARTLIDRLTRNGDRIVVLRPTTLRVITTALLQGDHGEAWAKTLASFVWVNGSQLVTTARPLTLSGSTPVPSLEDTGDLTTRTRWRKHSLRGLYVLSGFDAYFEQFTDSRRSMEKLLASETEADPYLATLITGLDTEASGRDQVLDEIGERAEEYYTGLWRTCTTNEQLVLMQLAQTGLVNGKARKDVRRLLARGLVRRDPQLRVMNESFRRFVLAHSGASSLAHQLESNLAGDAWNRFRIPFFAAVAVVLLFFFTTQRQMFDTTIAVVSGLVATLPAFVKTISGLGERAK